MELKKDESKVTQTNDSSQYQNPNNALFGAMDFDTPYQINNTTVTTTKKKGGFDSTSRMILNIACVLVAAAVFVAIYLQRNKYNGTYELTCIETEGYSFTVEQFETLAGFDVYGVIEVKGSRCKVDLDFTYLQTSGSAKIEFKGNKVTLTGDGTLEFEYDPDEKAIIYEEDGNRIIFEKVD